MGYCKSPPALVYPYMQRDSLFKNLHEWKVGLVAGVCGVVVYNVSGRGATFLEPQTLHSIGNLQGTCLPSQ